MTTIFVVAKNPDYSLGDEIQASRPTLGEAAEYANSALLNSRIRGAGPLYVFEVTVSPRLVASTATTVAVEEYRGSRAESQGADR